MTIGTFFLFIDDSAICRIANGLILLFSFAASVAYIHTNLNGCPSVTQQHPGR